MAEQEAPDDDQSDDKSDDDKSEASDTGQEAPDDEKSGATDEAEPGDGLDIDAQQARLDDVEERIAEGRRGLEDREQETEPEPDGPPVAQGEGAANAPPG